MFTTKLPGCTIWSPESNGFWTWARNGTPVTTVPDQIDVANSEKLRRELLAATAYSNVIIVDMSATSFCGCAGMGVLAKISDLLAENGGELRAVINNPNILRYLTITGDDRRFPIFPNLLEALSDVRQSHHAEPQAA